MVRVAIAGGTGSIGLYISRAILATQKHALVVLSRRKSHPELRSLGADIVAVDFTDPSSLVSALQGVHTVISATGMDPPETFVSSQLALLDAAVKAGAKRFAPSEWAIATMPNEPIQAYIPKHTVAERVAQSGLEYTIFENGIFMDYFATGTEGIGQLKPLSFVVDVEKGEAVIPGKGDNKVVFTSAGDVAAFVAASLDLETWPERSSMAGDVLSYNQVVEIAERVRGEWQAILE